MKTWFDIQSKASAPEEAEIFLYDEIGGFGVNAKGFIDSVRQMNPKKITLRINSPGGSVFDGLAIYNFLKERDVTVQIDGLAASIASVIAMAGKEVKIAGNGFLMIHNPWGGAMGEAEDMRQTADLLDKIRDSLIWTYAEKTGKEHEKIKEWMENETWFSAQEAKEHGFVDSITDEIAFSASINRFAKIPEALKAQNYPKNIMENLLKALLDAGLIQVADASEEIVVAQFNESFANLKKVAEENIVSLTEKLNAATAELTEAKAKLDEQAKTKVIAKVDAAIADGRIKADVRDSWVAQITTDPKALSLLDAIQTIKPGAEPVGAPASASAKTSADLRAEFDAITDPKKRSTFWSANKAQLLKR